MLIEAGALVVVGLAWIGKRVTETDATTRRLLRREPTSLIADLKDTTRAKIVGTTLRQDRLYPAPFVEKECIAWTLQVSGTAPGYAKIASLRSVPAFRVQDESGVATIDGRVESLAIKRTRFSFSKRSDRARLDAWLRTVDSALEIRKHIARALEPPFARVIFEVGVIEEGDRVAVHGLVGLTIDSDAGKAYRERSLKATLSENRSTGLTIAKL